MNTRDDFDETRESRVAAALKNAVKSSDIREAARQQRLMADELDRCADRLDEVYARMRGDLS